MKICKFSRKARLLFGIIKSLQYLHIIPVWVKNLQNNFVNNIYSVVFGSYKYLLDDILVQLSEKNSDVLLLNPDWLDFSFILLSACFIFQGDGRKMPPPKYAPIKKRKSKRAMDFAPPSRPESVISTKSGGGDSDSDTAAGFGTNWQGTV